MAFKYCAVFVIVSCWLVLEGSLPCQAARHLAMHADSRATTDPNSQPHQLEQLQRRSLLQFGGGNLVGSIGPVVGAVARGVDVGIGLAAPLVNAAAANVPVLVPSLNGLCMHGEPVRPFKQHPDAVMCLVGNGAQVTNALFGAASRLGEAAGGLFGGGYGYGRR